MADLNECSTPLYQPKLWDKINDFDVLKNSNCYSYAFNYIDYGSKKLQPGEINGTKYEKNTCPDIIDKMKQDYSKDDIHEVDYQQTLPCGRYKIALFVDKDNKNNRDDKDQDPDYHFYRQDNNGSWSHKTGTNKISNVDASGEKITDPIGADRNYKKKCEREKTEKNEKKGKIKR